MADVSSKTRSRKEPEKTDLAARLVQLQRKTAAETKPRSKADRPHLPSSPKPPELPKDKPPSKEEFVRDTKRDEFSRNMPVTTTPRLYDPRTDPVVIVPRRSQEHHQHESASDRDSNSPPKGVLFRSSHRPEPPPTRRLFDPKRDSPVRFTVLAKPPNPPAEPAKPPSSHRSYGDHVSASSTSISSYPPSLGSTTFTLTSASSSSSFFKQTKEDPNSPVVAQLKRLYRAISQAERKVLDAAQDDATPDQSRIMALQTRDQPVSHVIDPWAMLIADHKELAELMHSFLTLTLSPQVPVSFHQYPTSYNIPSRLWTNAFHRILESLRRASSESPVALEHLSEFISYAYNFYASLYENPILEQYKLGWLEALGDLARYRMVISAHMATAPFGERLSELPTPNVNKALLIPKDSKSGINGSQNLSVGPAAASALDLEPEREIWRKTARCWYAEALKDVPISGRLHHHLGVVSREGENEDLRAVYHFAKSMISSNPFPTARESILVMFTPAAQSRRIQPDAAVSDLFLLLHGMLFTHIQLDDFAPTKARFMERMILDGVEEREWIMMGLINFVSIFEYGRHDGAIKNVTVSAALGSSEARNVTSVVSRTEDLKIVADEDKKMDVDDIPDRDVEQRERAMLSSNTLEPSHSFQLALELTFSMLSHVLREPWRQANAFSRPSLNPYISFVLTCLSSLTKHSKVMTLLEHAIPWYDLIDFLNTVPRSIVDSEFEHAMKSLTHGCAALPEDWCLRGTEWMRRAYERGFWKTDIGGEIAVLDMTEEKRGDETDGIIEADEDEGSLKQDDTKNRFVRSLRAGVYLVRAVAGFSFDKLERRWMVEEPLRNKVEHWKEVERKEREADELRRTRRIAWSDDEDVMDVDGANGEEWQEEDSDEEEESEQVKELKARQRHFRALLASQHNEASSRTSTKRRRRPIPSRPRISLNVVAGYTILVVDTNILLSSLNLFSQLVESLKWTVVVPLAVVTELDGLATGVTQLAAAARASLDYLVSHLRSHSLALKVQTSRGNYLSSLVIRREQVDLDDERSWERNMDDLILRAAIWQDEHWYDRSALLKIDPSKPMDDSVAKVVLLSFDRNLRLKARSRDLCAADERDMAAILST